MLNKIKYKYNNCKVFTLIVKTRRVMLKAITWSLIIFFVYSPQLFALSNNYYSKVILSPSTQSDSDTFRKVLHESLAYFHIRQSKFEPDLISEQCPNNLKCYKHESLGYSGARIELLGHIHLESEGPNYFIQTLYCRQKLSKEDFGSSRGPAPGRIPDHSVLNTEHIWPQSKFSRSFPKHIQKSDLHSLYPTISKINSSRGSLPFGEVTSVEKEFCNNAKIGQTDMSSSLYFEPSAEVRGDIARALFYFSVRYKIAIDSTQEHFFRKWHIDDPVSEIEIEKNNMVFDVQGNRNPFVDHPEWVNLIHNF